MRYGAAAKDDLPKSTFSILEDNVNQQVVFGYMQMLDSR